MILEQIRRLQTNGTEDHEFSIFWTPRRTFLANQILEDEGITGDVNVYEYPFYFFPLEDDVLSLELADSFGEIYLVWCKNKNLRYKWHKKLIDCSIKTPIPFI